MGTLIFYSLIGGLFSLIGGFVLLWKREITQALTTPLLSFAAGAFLGAALLDILPEALEIATDPQLVLIWMLGGFILYFVLERLLMTYVYKHPNAQNSHSDHTETLPILLILGDTLHNFLDGIVIALAYVVNPAVGLVTTLAVAAHEIPQEIGDFSVLLHQGWAKKVIIAVNVLQSLTTLPGAVLGFYVGHLFTPYLPYILAFTAGIFIYISASDIIPEIHHKAGHKSFYRVVIPLVLAVVIVGYLTRLAHA
ncbi:hypothetical protein A2634_05280 [Candidatus Amesbacteria bacterium RIFCSPHIGHO2_01_FULL_48_32]|uniref:ZIP zinc transporter n=1 Tax=Candidatus Amesbacteria bacterium RIFCSPLOWO2_01_FULL_48_25 TaxID=1797259 RepID=A0A1F4ZCJ2_9BACT|nr:MAG: hypothetical protein A2634_05280 [Candidatus Amesbacteria bacterium RIFCSPHIGHO2_01_FULL_48_32]OGD04079.1 MAG: hypothetical protein A2989_01625 [Candidatus Amesbacteria bacterium RIFCSPLOWO2_01_FULL_48_25]HJZ05655.1 ZIP family metal transporter [Patescibacteria group bacterium]